MIVFYCPGCGQKYELGDEYAGMRGECEVCGKEFDIPQKDKAVKLHTITPQSRKTDPTKPKSSAPEMSLETSTGKKMLAVFAALVLAVSCHLAVTGAVGFVLRMPLEDAAEEARLREREAQDFKELLKDRTLKHSPTNDRRFDRMLQRKMDSALEYSRAKKEHQTKAGIVGFFSLVFFALCAILSIIGIFGKKYTISRSRHNFRAAIIFGAFVLILICAAATGPMVAAFAGVIAGIVAVLSIFASAFIAS